MSDALAPPIVLIDNFDSFTYNLYQLLCMRVSGRQNPVAVIRNDQTDLKNLVKLKPVSIVISPGPGGPKDTGISRTVIEHFCGKIPILGVCLGHQLIADV
ncbi:MAG: hypothetical protein KDD53_03285, partial [Bdellovibrionales bacterium]|nr:hypothetical protein [Bdellovibrionales bacterium]